MSLRYNAFKVSIGFLLGTALLYLIHDLEIIWISVIQLIFFSVLYAGIDNVVKRIKKEREGT